MSLAPGDQRDVATTPASVEASYGEGQAALARGDLAAARDWLARCTAAPGGADDARCAALAGAIAVEEGDFDAAAGHYRRAAQLAPDDVALARQLGEALSAAGAVDEAIGVLEEAERRRPDDPDTLVDLGFVRMLAGDTAGARAALERAAALRPDDPGIQRALGQIYEAAGEPERATEALAATGEAITAQTATDLARLYLQVGRYDEAEGVFRRLRALDPDAELVALHGMIWCRIKRQDWRGGFDLALSATRVDRLGLTTALLAYARDRLFGRAPDAASREAELEERLVAELREYYDEHYGL